MLPGAAAPDVAVPPKSVPAAFVVLFVVPKGVVEVAALPVFAPNNVPADVLLVVPAPKRVPAAVFVVAGVVPNPVVAVAKQMGFSLIVSQSNKFSLTLTCICSKPCGWLTRTGPKCECHGI